MTSVLRQLISQYSTAAEAINSGVFTPLHQSQLDSAVEKLGQYSLTVDDLKTFQQLVKDPRFKLSIWRNAIRGDWDVTAPAQHLFGPILIRATQHVVFCENFALATLESQLTEDFYTPDFLSKTLDFSYGPITLVLDNGKQVTISRNEDWGGSIVEGPFQPVSLVEG